MKLKPLGDRVLVQRSEDSDEKSVGGIIIPDTAKEKPQRGKVVAAGPGAIKEDGTRTPLDVKAGDNVLFGKAPIVGDEKLTYSAGSAYMLGFNTNKLTMWIHKDRDLPAKKPYRGGTSDARII